MLHKDTHVQKVVDTATGSGSKAPLWWHSQMHFKTVRPSDSNKQPKFGQFYMAFEIRRSDQH